jgi:integrase
MMCDSHTIIFLDIDGILNQHQYDREILCGQIYRDKVEVLNRILRATDARIVLSSAWRYIVHRREANLMGLEWLFRSHGMLANRLVGVTREDTMVRGAYGGEPHSWPLSDERGRQIADWLAEHSSPGAPYVVIDDGGTADGEWTDLGIVAAGHPFVWVDGKVGLTDADADRAIAILNGEAK